MKSLKDIPHHREVVVAKIGGERSFRRRLMEMGIVPGTKVKIVNVAPLGDPLEIAVRHSRLSIRRREAARLSVVG